MDKMDSGGVLRLHYSFCYSLSFRPSLFHAPHVHPLRTAGEIGGVHETPPSLGATRTHVTLIARGGDG